MKKLSTFLLLILLFTSIGKINAQSDLLTDNTVPVSSNIDSIYANDEKISIIEFMPTEMANITSSLVSVKCLVPITMKVNVFNMNGQMAKDEIRNLAVGINQFSVDMSNLAKGMYMVQFYSEEGSAVRRFIKMN